MILLNHALLSILLRNKEDRGGLLRIRRLDISLGELIIQECFYLLLFIY